MFKVPKNYTNFLFVFIIENFTKSKNPFDMFDKWYFQFSQIFYELKIKLFG